jgi:hypothetical protein
MSMATRAPGTGLAVLELSLPAEWRPTLAAWPRAEAPAGVVAALRRVRDNGLLSSLRGADGFLLALRTALAGPSRSAVVTYSDPRRVVEVVSLLGALLGDVTYAASPTLGGPASAVPTGGIDRYEQAWHTDSTPWTVPNRWSVLGLLREDPALPDAPTSILPWSALLEGWHLDAGLLRALHGHRLSWREQYPALPPLSAPILGDVPRWFRPALADLIDDPARRVAECHALDDALRHVTSWYETVIAPGRVLIFDNHAALHRGPAVREPSPRTLLRLKTDGIPER